MSKSIYFSTVSLFTQQYYSQNISTHPNIHTSMHTILHAHPFPYTLIHAHQRGSTVWPELEHYAPTLPSSACGQPATTPPPGECHNFGNAGNDCMLANKLHTHIMHSMRVSTGVTGLDPPLPPGYIRQRIVYILRSID